MSVNVQSNNGNIFQQKRLNRRFPTKGGNTILGKYTHMSSRLKQKPKSSPSGTKPVIDSRYGRARIKIDISMMGSTSEGKGY